MIIRIVSGILIISVLALVIIKAVDLKELVTLLVHFPIEKLVFVVLLSALISVLKSWRFLILLRHNNISVSFWDNLKAFLASQTTTPLPGGETMRGVLVKKETGVGMSKISGSVLTQAYVEFLSSALIFIIGSFILESFRLPALLILFLIIMLTIVLLHNKTTIYLTAITTYLNRLKYISRRVRIIQKGFQDNIVSDDDFIVEKTFIWSLLIAVLVNILGGVVIYMIASSLGGGITFMESIFIFAASIVLQALSVFSPGGIGFTEGGVAGILLNFGMSLNQSVAIVVLFRTVTLVFSVCLGLLFLMIFYGKGLFLKK